MTKFAIAAAVALTAVAGAASADEITLTKPLSGATLHEGAVDMAVYMTEAEDGLEVVATYTPTETYAPARVAMVLADGDAVSFGLPGARTAHYTFARTGDNVTVTARPVAVQFASN
ncbi:MAG: hypothetical protein CML66_15760 [Rhodobacteraceae bacterium]|nr:hypothetical protein [Paracoccaceae bacterium]MAY44510.1 hypothetical protein [Paracoccaceae bacterium]QEW18215.1 hypothetical protein LA6_000376 [Marinibacterium anthonyi]|tara:strand:- start:229 stop:576 length:348 start_codon:yes stop_codon:yes gene_type:complete